jgi:transcriptional regulator with XRE-family HTH domain
MAFQADRLKAMREAKGWRAVDLARAALTTEGQVSRYESGGRVPSADIVAKIATALEMSADFFLGIDNRFLDISNPRNIAARLTLEWLNRQADLGRDEYAQLLDIARQSQSPPVSLSAWTTVREALAISVSNARVQQPANVRPLVGRARRARPLGPS